MDQRVSAELTGYATPLGNRRVQDAIGWGMAIPDARSVTSGFRSVNFAGWLVEDVPGQIRGMRERICQDIRVADLAGRAGRFGCVARIFAAIVRIGRLSGRDDQGLSTTSVSARSRQIARPWDELH